MAANDTLTNMSEQRPTSKDLEKGSIEHERHSPHEAGTPLIVHFESGDNLDPHQWPAWKRYGTVAFASWLNVLVCIGASGYSTGSTEIAEEFGVSDEVVTLGLSLYVLGFAFGPMLLAPFSEFYGRKPIYLVSWFIFTVFQIPLAVAPNIATVLVCRFIQGFMGSTPLANTGGVVHDIFRRDESGFATSIYALSSTIGPPFGNGVTGYIAQNLGWRWLFWFNLIVFGAHFLILLVFFPETRDTIILMKKARQVREKTGNDDYVAPHENDRKQPGRLWKVSLWRPFKFLFTEPITIFSALYNGFLFGLIFLFNEAFPLMFGTGNGGHGWTHSGTVNLTFLSLVVGSVLAWIFSTPFQERFYQAALTRNDGKSVPEARVACALIGTFLLPIGLFIAAWTSYQDITFIAPLIGATIFGFGFYQVLYSILNYVVDGYGHYSASALAGVVLVRNLFGAGFPLFARQMYVNLGNQWATCLLAFLSILLIPIPFYLFYYGRTVRYASPYCREHFDEED